MGKIYYTIVLGLFLNSYIVKGQSNVLSAAPDVPPDLYIEEMNRVGQQSGIPLNPENPLNAGNKVMSCPTSNTLVSGYPAWTNYWAGWMVNINNISTNTVNISCFEARFQGTSGYRIHTKNGTFVGFESTAGAWTLIGTATNVASISTTTSSPVPITVNQTILPGATRAFYLSRTDNLVANRHLYIAGTGTPGVTVYASDANIQITEANYIDVYFINMGGTRRPSFQVYYSLIVPLPVELTSFDCMSNKINMQLNWVTATERNCDYFGIERSSDGNNFEEIGRVEGAGNSNSTKKYTYTDENPLIGINYYRLRQVDISGETTYSHLSTCLFQKNKTKINIYSYTGVLLASAETDDYAAALNELNLNSGIYMVEFTGAEPSFIKYTHLQH